jgi:DNA-binding CsgD family transcriptional regulator
LAGVAGSLGATLKGAQWAIRELDIERLMLSGCSSKEIARKLESG